VRQLLDLEPLWSKHDYFFVTEDTALGRSLIGSHRTYLVPHFAWGQAKLGAPFRMLATAFRSFFRTAAIILKERPTVTISTGAGAVFFALLWAKALGSRIVVIESFARFEGPSLFGRLAAPLAHDLIVQSPKLAKAYPKARIFDPMRVLDVDAPAKKDLLFATVGATLPFDRMVEAVGKLQREGALPKETIVQTGVGGVAPAGLSVVETLSFDEVRSILHDAAIVVCHGGTGSLITALREGCQVIAMPRRSELGEHYDDHQTEITRAFEQRGLVQVADTVDELRDAVRLARTRKAVVATSDPSALIAFLNQTLDTAR
jgi:UDP-N-acetylglucosamine transferase subunit ALG13